MTDKTDEQQVGTKKENGEKKTKSIEQRGILIGLAFIFLLAGIILIFVGTDSNEQSNMIETQDTVEEIVIEDPTTDTVVEKKSNTVTTTVVK